MIFVYDGAPGEDPGTIAGLVSQYEAVAEKLRTLKLGGQKVGYVDPAPVQPGQPAA